MATVKSGLSMGETPKASPDGSNRTILESSNAEGIMRISEITSSMKGQEEVEKLIKIVEVKKVITPAMKKRIAEWKPFGEPSISGNANVTIRQVDPIPIVKTVAVAEPVSTKPIVAEGVYRIGQSGTMVCGNCGGPHWTLTCTAGKGKEAAKPKTPGLYVPPPTSRTATGEIPDEQKTALRVSNLSPEASQQQLHELFSQFGHVVKCNISTDRRTGIPRGYAIITFASHSSAAEAKEKLHGFPIDNLLISVEWDRATGSGQVFYSGYGKKLAQDEIKV